jgi:hypothetical protein
MMPPRQTTLVSVRKFCIRLPGLTPRMLTSVSPAMASTASRRADPVSSPQRSAAAAAKM